MDLDSPRLREDTCWRVNVCPGTLSSNYQSQIADPQPANRQDSRLAIGNRSTEDYKAVIAKLPFAAWWPLQAGAGSYHMLLTGFSYGMKLGNVPKAYSQHPTLMKVCIV